MKQFLVEIGGKERALRYTFADARALVRRFGPLPKALNEDQLGMFGVANVNPDFQVAFVAAGLAHERDLKQLPLGELEDKVTGWFDELCGENGPGIGSVLVGAFKAALYAGIVHGKSVDWEGELKKQVDLRTALAGETPGKGEAAAEEPPPAA